MSERSPHVKMAMETIEVYVKDGRVLEVPPDTPEELRKTRAGVFVCLKKDGNLRGCIGTIEPVQESIAHEIIANAISSAAHDPRFMPVEEDELDELVCSVDVLTEPEAIDGQGELDPRKYGVIVECGGRRGVLLPDLEGVDTVEQQVDIARRKALIGVNDPIKLYRFEVRRHG